MERLRRLAGSDDGLGLIEVIVAMFLLALFAVVLLPVLITGMQLAATNTTNAAAAQLANGQVKAAQSASPDCAAVAAVADVFETTDKRGVPLNVTTTTGACPAATGAGQSTTLEVNVVVTTDAGKVLATATTRVFIKVEP
jgi:type II secretory pathway pseudopilin PulG